MIEEKTVGIIGINGRCGQACRRLCEHMGHTVIGSDFTTDLTNREVVEEADVVIFSVLPLAAALSVVEQMIPHSRSEQLWMDVGSLKTPMVNAMMHSHAEVLGMHPLFAPPKEATWEGRTLVVYHARVETWGAWAHAFLEATGAHRVEVQPSIHDSEMLGPQNLTHLAVLGRALAIKALGLQPDRLAALSTLPSQRMDELLHRMLRQSPDVYADIQFENPDALKAMDALLGALGTLRGMMVRRDRKSFVEVFPELINYFGGTLPEPSDQ